MYRICLNHLWASVKALAWFASRHILPPQSYHSNSYVHTTLQLSIWCSGNSHCHWYSFRLSCLTVIHRHKRWLILSHSPTRTGRYWLGAQFFVSYVPMSTTTRTRTPTPSHYHQDIQSECLQEDISCPLGILFSIWAHWWDSLFTLSNFRNVSCFTLIFHLIGWFHTLISLLNLPSIFKSFFNHFDSSLYIGSLSVYHENFLLVRAACTQKLALNSMDVWSHVTQCVKCNAFVQWLICVSNMWSKGSCGLYVGNCVPGYKSSCIYTKFLKWPQPAAADGLEA